MSPGEALGEVLAELRACRICRDAPLYLPPLPHQPRPVIQASVTARICIAGQAPGTRVHASGRPFTDPSGVRLRHWLGIDETVFYDAAKIAIVPMGHCFPGLDVKGGDRVFANLPQIDLVLAIGRYAQNWHLGPKEAANLSATVANWRDILVRPVLPRVLPLPHPSWRNNAWIKRNPWFEDELLPVLRDEVARLLR